MRLETLHTKVFQPTGGGSAVDHGLLSVVERDTRTVFVMNDSLGVEASFQLRHRARYVAAISRAHSRIACVTETGLSITDLQGRPLFRLGTGANIDEAFSFLDAHAQLLTLGHQQQNVVLEIRSALDGAVVRAVSLGSINASLFRINVVTQQRAVVSWRAGEHSLGHAIVDLTSGEVLPRQRGFIWSVSGNGGSLIKELEERIIEQGAFVVDLTTQSSTPIEGERILTANEEFVFPPAFLMDSSSVLICTRALRPGIPARVGCLDPSTHRWGWAQLPAAATNLRELVPYAPDTLLARYQDQKQRPWMALWRIVEP